MNNQNDLSKKWNVRSLEENDIPDIVANFLELGWNKPASLYQQYLQEQNNNERLVWVAWHNKVFLGYVTLKWVSEYEPFKLGNIPEIKDLNVLPSFRRQGLGNHLMDLAEKEASIKSELVGLSVGLFSDYGSAQRIYVERGYVPDGKGITYKDKKIKWGELVQVDDDLVLWFTKKIR